MMTDVEERADMRMRELGDDSRLPLEALARVGRRGRRGRENLDGNRAIETCIARLVDFTHPAGAERAEDLVRPEARAGREAHAKSLTAESAEHAEKGCLCALSDLG